MTTLSEQIVESFAASVHAANVNEAPYPHWFLDQCVPAQVIDDVRALPFDAPSLDGVSGKRELHNATRTYFDAANREAHPVVDAMADAFQCRATTDLIEETFKTNLDDSLLRIEYAQDINGFWLEPHTDLGVKVFTMLLYVSKDPSHENLGTDIYDSTKQHIGRSPFAAGSAMVFVPSDITYHGFEERKIEGVRQSIIINYVTQDWRAREQLAFPEQPIGS
ncbi:MAG: 2OG-Fe(II) oxygenase [Pseudomonadota bacterium]